VSIRDELTDAEGKEIILNLCQKARRAVAREEANDFTLTEKEREINKLTLEICDELEHDIRSGTF
jgi:hypothetical protein